MVRIILRRFIAHLSGDNILYYILFPRSNILCCVPRKWLF